LVAVYGEGWDGIIHGIMRERRTVLFSGRVQGVGFRATAVSFARGTRVSGTVRNLEDGKVELVVAGAREELDRLISRLREHFEAESRTVQQEVGPAEASEPGIRVLH
jgi:acylphosphatase